MGKPIELDQVLKVLGDAVMTVRGPRKRMIAGPAALQEASDPATVAFCSKTGEDAAKLIGESGAGVILCGTDVPDSPAISPEKTLILVAHPRLSFMRLLGAFFTEPKPRGIHPSAVVHPQARIHPSAYVGPFCVIGECEVGEESILYGHNHLYSKTRLGRRVIVHAGAVLGADGFGFQRNDKEELEKFPHVGGILIEDDVEIGANTCIDRGTLSDTIIRQGAKIDNLVHIAHNAVVGRHSVIVTHAVVAGSTKVGDYAWVAPCACLRDGITVGNHALIGMGAVVVKDVPDGQTVLGNPARPLQKRGAE